MSIKQPVIWPCILCGEEIPDDARLASICDRCFAGPRALGFAGSRPFVDLGADASASGSLNGTVPPRGCVMCNCATERRIAVMFQPEPVAGGMGSNLSGGGGRGALALAAVCGVHDLKDYATRTAAIEAASRAYVTLLEKRHG